MSAAGPCRQPAGTSPRASAIVPPRAPGPPPTNPAAPAPLVLAGRGSGRDWFGRWLRGSRWAWLKGRKVDEDRKGLRVARRENRVEAAAGSAKWIDLAGSGEVEG